jgi:hypothetical protein
VLFVAVHQVEIELGDTQAGKFGEPVSKRRGRANDAEAIDDFIRNEVAVAAVDFAVMPVIVRKAGGQKAVSAGGRLSIPYFLEHIQDMVGDKRRKPSHSFPPRT